jgi:ABC-type amino acid transport substrate-binding protein
MIAATSGLSHQRFTARRGGCSNISTPKDLQGKTAVITQGSLNLSVGEKVIAEAKVGVTVMQAKDHGFYLT